MGRHLNKLITGMALGAMLALSGQAALAEDFPAKPITLVVPFAAGGPTDTAGRLIAQAMEQNAGQPVVVQNVDGAGSTIGAAQVAAAAPDGYTLLMATSTAMVVAPHIYKTLAFDGYKAFDPIGLVTQAPFILLVGADSPYKTLGDLLGDAKANPEKLNYATPGLGTVQHLSLEMLLEAAGAKATHVPFKGTTPARTAFLGGEVDFMIETPNAANPLIESGKARALAVMTTERLEALPDVPTTREAGVDVQARSWFALMAPKGTDPKALAVLQDLLAKALADPKTGETMAAAGFVPTPMGADELGAMMAVEYDNFARVVKNAGISIN